jgi:CubicO group peptidase (beta-lactamase class C family)
VHEVADTTRRSQLGVHPMRGPQRTPVGVPRASRDSALERMTTSSLSRRRFLSNVAKAAAVGVVAPALLTRRASAETDSLHRFLVRSLAAADTPGIAVAVVRGEEIVYSAGVGWADREQGIPVTPQTAFQLASISKTVTCAGIMALVETGRLDLDADINGYLPFEVRIPAAPRDPITMRHLLTHTSAIRDRANVWGTPWTKHTMYFHGDSPISLERFMRSYYMPGGTRYDADHNFYRRPPGTRYAYSNLAVALAGFVAQRVSGVDFDRWCIRRILRPLGMAHSGYRLADVGSTNVAMPYAHNRQGLKPIYLYGYPDYPDGALRTSALHLARWLGAFMSLGTFQGARVLETDTVKEIRRNQLHGMVGWHQGLIWYSDAPWGFYTLGHTGGDFGESTRMFFRPDKRVGVVTLTNSFTAGPNWRAFSDIERRLFAEFS